MNKKTCKNCKFESAPNKCLRGTNGEMLEYNAVKSVPGQHDEYDLCIFWKEEK